MPTEGETRVNRLDPSRKAIFSSGQWYEIGGGATGASKPLPIGVQNLEAQDLNALNTAGSMNATIDQNVARLQNGQLDLGPIKNVVSGAKNWMGASDPNSRNYASFRAGLEKMRNDSLKLAKGTQTEGDAQRAWNEILSNLNDEKLVSQRLQEVEAMNNRAIDFHANVVNQRRSQYGQAPIDPTKYTGKPLKTAVPDAARARHEALSKTGVINPNAPYGSAQNPFVARDAATLEKLPSGTYAISPDGVLGKLQ